MQAADAPMRIPRRTASDIEQERMADEFWENALDEQPSHATAAEKLALQLYAEAHPQEKQVLHTDELENHGGEEYMHVSSASDVSSESELSTLPPKRSNADAGLWWGQRKVNSPHSADQSTTRVSSEGSSSSRSSSDAVREVVMPDMRAAAAAAVEESDIVLLAHRHVPPSSRHLPAFLTKKNRRKNTMPAAASRAAADQSTDLEVALRQVISDEQRAAAEAKYAREEAAIEAVEAKAMDAHMDVVHKEKAQRDQPNIDLNKLQRMKPLTFSVALVALEDYIITRKVDGNRAYWDGLKGVFYSKHGSIAVPPPNWAKQMPKQVWLDGELYREEADGLKFKTDLSSVSAVWQHKPLYNKHNEEQWWSSFKYMAFDILNPKLLTKPLTTRLGVLDKYKPLRANAVFDVMPHRVFKSELYATREAFAEALMQYCKKKKTDWGDAFGAEGLVLKRASSPYKGTAGYTRMWLKYKFYEDIEARVTFGPKLKDAPKQGESRYYVMVELPMGGNQIVVNTANGRLLEDKRLQPGSIVNLQYMQGTDVREPVIRSVVEDGRRWDQVVRDYRVKQAALSGIEAPAAVEAAAAAQRPSSGIAALMAPADQDEEVFMNLLGY